MRSGCHDRAWSRWRHPSRARTVSASADRSGVVVRQGAADEIAALSVIQVHTCVALSGSGVSRRHAGAQPELGTRRRVTTRQIAARADGMAVRQTRLRHSM